MASDETGQNPIFSAEHEQEPTDVGIDIDDELLDATGYTQILSEEMAVATGVGLDRDATMLAPGDASIDEPADDAETMLAPMDDDEDDFDFAKTEALPP